MNDLHAAQHAGMPYALLTAILLPQMMHYKKRI
jgi:hypothetical protein